MEGLKKHMENCRLVRAQWGSHKVTLQSKRVRLNVGTCDVCCVQQPFTCQHCGKQLKSSTGMKYHIMADHSHLVRRFSSAHFLTLRLPFRLRCVSFTASVSSLNKLNLFLSLALIGRCQGPGRSRHQRQTAENPEEAGQIKVLQRGEETSPISFHEEDFLE